jgi:hypothetical protein
MSTAETELMGELEDELEEEALELEPLFSRRRASAQRFLSPALMEASAPPPNRFTFSATPKIIPRYSQYGKPRDTVGVVYVADEVWKQKPVPFIGKRIDLLLFFPGDNTEKGPCKHDFDPEKVIKGFQLDTQIHKATRKLALAVPAVFWEVGTEKNVKGIWTAARFNAFVQEVLDQITKRSGIKTELGSLIIAGHSHAYGILNPLAFEFNKNVADTNTGAMARLAEVWALDSTYGAMSARALESWAYALPTRCRFTAVLNKRPAEKDERRKPIDGWNRYVAECSFGYGPPPNLQVCKVADEHCNIPLTYVGQLLSAMSLSGKDYPPSWCKS